jgi:hypothetical protein
MLARFVQDTPEIDQSGTVEPESFHCATACGRQPEDALEVVTPDEMILPPLAPRVEESNRQSRRGIERFDLGEFVIVATLTGKSQIIRIVPASGLDWKDVLDRKTFRSKAFLAAAISQRPPARERIASLVSRLIRPSIIRRRLETQLVHQRPQGRSP